MATELDSPLDTIDPKDAWAPADPKQWNVRWAAHLYRRAAFGAPPVAVRTKTSTWEALQAAVERGMEASLAELFTGAAGQDDFDTLMDSLGKRIAQSSSARFGGIDISKLQGWWLYRMLYTPHPLLERCTMFWHNHFATSVAKVASVPLMFKQNQTLRQHALGKFRPMLEQISRDPAMVIWLDSNRNTKGAPNENYAREVMELFTLGVGNYTEHDIREAARAFTGWGTAGGEFIFNAALHDDGQKTVLGRTGNWDGDDVLRILLEQPAAARIVVREFYRHFVSEIDPPDTLLEPLADGLRKSDYDFAGLLQTMLSSRLFFSEHAYRHRIKGPVEYVVSLIKAFDGSAEMATLAASMEGMGQSLFEPPNVKGWDGGAAWIDSATLLARHNLAWKLIGRSETEPFQIDPEALAKQFGGNNIKQQVDFLLDLLLQSDVGDDVRAELRQFSPKRGKKNRIKQVAHAILATPEYQLA